MKEKLIFFNEEDLKIESNLLILKELLLYKKEDGKVCPKCKFIQGKPKNGFDKYYCIHTRNKINRKMRKRNNELLKLKIIYSNLLRS